MRASLLKTLAGALALHGVATVGVPWLLLNLTREQSGSRMPIGLVHWLGVPVALFGVYLYLWAMVRLLRRGTSALPGVLPRHLEMDGWYARVRHPLLVGVIVILLGEAIVWLSAALLAYALAYWAMLNIFVARYEEPQLVRAFGKAYDAYRSRVPRWIPRGSVE